VIPTTAEIGDSAELKVGHLVLAVGYGPRASWGVVSAVGGAWRTGRGGEVDRLLRVDLVLYPGFSGGPLVDASGKVAGLVTSGLSRQLELAVADRDGDTRGGRAAGDRTRQPWLCWGWVSSRWLFRRPWDGWRRARTRADSSSWASWRMAPAARAGLMLGDVLVALEGTPLHDLGDVQAAIADGRAGTAVTVSLFRAGTPLDVAVTLAERPSRRR
jgi:S1-C subfamily serine protease